MTEQTNSLTAEIRVPMSKDIGGPAKVEEIPLPPPELWGELENSGVAESEAEGAAASAKVEPARPAEVATLDFVVETIRPVALKFPFRLDGRLIERVEVRRLTTAEVDDFIRAHPKGFTTFDVFAVMTRLPAPVLRGLIAEDGDAVTDAASDFLPPSIRSMFGSPES